MKLTLAVIAAVFLFLFSWSQGAGQCGWHELWLLFRGQEVSEAAKVILLQIRLPRLLAAILVGGMLSGAGCATQNMFRNDLASPHVLGIVNSAALGAVLGLFLGAGMVMPLGILFGVASLLLLFIPGRRRQWDSASLILAGIAVNAFTSAVTSGTLYLADERLASIVFWLLGGFWRISWWQVGLLTAAALPGLGVLWVLSTEMDMLLLGDRAAALAGVRLRLVKPLVMLAIAVLTAVAVSCCGVIGFVGLAVPHMARFMVGARFRRLLPAAVFAGSMLLLAADLLARTVASPQEVPVGILTALGGGPFFFYLLLRDKGSQAT